MNMLTRWVLMFVSLCLACLCAQADTVESFFLDPPRKISNLSVGADGDIWFADQQSLMRLYNGDFETMCEFPARPYTVPQVTMSPSGTIYLDNFKYQYSPDAGLLETDVLQPSLSQWDVFCIQGIIDGDERMFCIWGPWRYMDEPYASYDFGTWELYDGRQPEVRLFSCYVWDVVPVSAQEFWMETYYYRHTTGGPQVLLRKANLERGQHDCWFRMPWACQLNAKDSQGRIWMTGGYIFVFQGDELTVFAGDEWMQLSYFGLCLGADGTVWSACRRASATSSTVRFKDGDRYDFFQNDWFPGSSSFPSLIDYDGRVWLKNHSTEGTITLSSITDGGWPPMRLSFSKVETEGTIAVEANVINNGPVVGVDVYLAIYLSRRKADSPNGELDQLLYWPTWRPEPCPIQINLRPGHNQTATLLEMQKSAIPPGAYTFYGCMTGRNTQKLIGPIGRKFEALTIEVAGGK